jgi:CNT family concentrative nucleoside transporter
MTIMTAGMAHVSGGIMAAYVLVAHVDVVHLLTAVVMTAPGAIMVAKIMVPETETPKTGADVDIRVPPTDVNLVDAAARGAAEGMHLALNVAAMLIAFIALVALVNGCLGFMHGGLNSLAQRLPNSFSFLGAGVAYFPESLQQILGIIFRPIAWSMGVSWKDSFEVGNLLGTRLVLNEFVAFLQLGQIGSTLDTRSFTITTFALCGFANFGSIAIQVGGIGALAPSRRHDLASLGIKAMIAGTLANFLSATIAGMIL